MGDLSKFDQAAARQPAQRTAQVAAATAAAAAEERLKIEVI
jgi:hypothetical protein